MAIQSKTHTPVNKPSKLDTFSLSFEYNIPWDEASKTMQHRPSKK